jgi:hypothetical protein
MGLRRLRLAGACIPCVREIHNSLIGKSEGTRSFWSFKSKYEDNIKMNLKEICYMRGLD